MVGSWLDTTIIVVIVIIGLFIMYRALKEPIDLILSLIGRGLGSIRDRIVDAKDSGGEYYDEIRYG